MVAYPLVTTLSLRLRDKVGAERLVRLVRHYKLLQLLLYKRKHANKKYEHSITLNGFRWWLAVDERAAVESILGI